MGALTSRAWRSPASANAFRKPSVAQEPNWALLKASTDSLSKRASALGKPPPGKSLGMFKNLKPSKQQEYHAQNAVALMDWADKRKQSQKQSELLKEDPEAKERVGSFWEAEDVPLCFIGEDNIKLAKSWTLYYDAQHGGLSKGVLEVLPRSAEANALRQQQQQEEAPEDVLQDYFNVKDEAEGPPRIVFKGEISTLNPFPGLVKQTGYAVALGHWFNPPLDCGERNCFVLKIRTDNKCRFHFFVKDGLGLGRSVHMALIPQRTVTDTTATPSQLSMGEWRTVFLPFDKFKEYYGSQLVPNPTPLDFSQIVHFGFSVKDQDLPFRLELQYINCIQAKGVRKRFGLDDDAYWETSLIRERQGLNEK